jgi:NAD+ synthase (glutamine-hydrolysing)
MRVALAQTNPVTGDLEGNVRQIISNIRRAKEDEADFVVFPEAAITGYCCGALFEQEEFVRNNKTILEEIVAREVPENMVAVVGFVDYHGHKKSGALDITNAAAIIQGGKVIDTYHKTLLANDGHHEDRKYFTPGEVKVTTTTLNGEEVTFGTPICEDVWNIDHTRDIVQEMKDLGADVILSPNFSYFHYGKDAKRRDLFGGHAKDKQVPVVGVNAAGVGDIVKNVLIYDGGSFAFNEKGECLAQCDRFSADYKVVDLNGPVKEFNIQPKYEEIFDALTFEQKEMFRVTGLQKAQVHVSGGLDSSIVAPLVVEAMGPDKTVFITNPTECNSEQTQGDAYRTGQILGVPVYTNAMQEPYEALSESFTDAFDADPSGICASTMHAVGRTVQGLTAANHFGTGIVAAGNHTEIVEGWANFHDIGSVGVHALIGGLTKTELFEFAPYINERMGVEVVPKHLYDGSTKPAAELPDANEDPIDYYVRAGIDAELIRERKSITQLVDDFKTHTLTEDFFPLTPTGESVYQRYSVAGFTEQVQEAYSNAKRSVFKCAQSAPTVIVAPRDRGFSSRETIINKYKGTFDLEAFSQEVLQ